MAESGAATLGTARGRAAEAMARRHFEDAGWRVVAANLRTAGGELDLVAWDGPVLVFVEVKGRSRSSPFAPEEAVDQRKRQRLTGAAQAYLAGLPGPEPRCRFDVVAVDFVGGRAMLRHMPDAFRPGD